MANRNIRVYELAKELNKTSREIISLLAEKNIEVTTHMATLEDNQADQVRAQVNQESAKAAEGAAQDAKPKKKKFIVVHNPENSRDRKSPERRPAQPKTQAAKPAQKPAAAPKAEAKPAAKPEVKPAAAPKAAETRTENKTEGRPAGRPQGDRQGYNRGDRPQGDRQGAINFCIPTS